MTGSEPVPGVDPTGFGSSWWAQAWLDALHQRAQLDPNRLPRGLDYARGGNVSDLAIGPGEARARVGGRESDPYRVRIRVRTFDDGQWAQVLDAIAARAGNAAAMLAGHLPTQVADDVARAGLGLLPGPGELGPRCTCPDEADPCKHAAAVGYLVAQALDRDPFLVLTIRGRSRDEVLAGLRTRHRLVDPADAEPAALTDPGRHDVTDDPGCTDPVDEGVDARAVFAARPGPSPVPPLPPQRPGRPAPLPLDLPPQLSGLRADLLALATDAAHRAWELATGASGDAGLGLAPDADLARRADAALGTDAFSLLAATCGVPERDLARQALAWRHGGLAGFETLQTGWDPVTEGDPGTTHLLDTARIAVQQASGLSPRRQRNRITVARLQLRLGRDYHWYPYRRIGTNWEPAGRAHRDPTTALIPLLPS